MAVCIGQGSACVPWTRNRKTVHQQQQLGIIWKVLPGRDVSVGSLLVDMPWTGAGGGKHGVDTWHDPSPTCTPTFTMWGVLEEGPRGEQILHKVSRRGTEVRDLARTSILPKNFLADSDVGKRSSWAGNQSSTNTTKELLPVVVSCRRQRRSPPQTKL